MGTNLESQELISRKNDLLDSILVGTRGWDGGIDTGIELVEINQKKLDFIKEINNELYSMEGEFVDMDTYNEKLNLVVTELEKLIMSMKESRKRAIQEKKILERKDEVLENYISKKNRSFFIDKDV